MSGCARRGRASTRTTLAIKMLTMSDNKGSDQSHMFKVCESGDCNKIIHSRDPLHDAEDRLIFVRGPHHFPVRVCEVKKP